VIRGDKKNPHNKKTSGRKKNIGYGKKPINRIASTMIGKR
jgi:hypothetical protein